TIAVSGGTASPNLRAPSRARAAFESRSRHAARATARMAFPEASADKGETSGVSEPSASFQRVGLTRETRLPWRASTRRPNHPLATSAARIGKIERNNRRRHMLGQIELTFAARGMPSLRIVWPGMLRVAAGEFLFHLQPAGFPKAVQVFGHLP